jgi:FixJ family two-component response regulator
MRHHRCELPAILITTHVSASLQQRAGAAGMSVVEKPLMDSSLVDAINIFVPRSHGAKNAAAR